MTAIDPTTLIGYAAASQRGTDRAVIVSSIERTDGGDTLLSVGDVSIFRSGDHGRVQECATVRLTSADRDRLIEALVWHRTASSETASAAQVTT